MIEILRNRRSVRSFLHKQVEQEKIEIIIESALRSPTSRNLKPTEFILVKERETLELLGKVKAHGAEFLKNANFAVVVIADTLKSDTCIEDASIASIVMQLTAEGLGLGSCWAQIRLRFDENGVSAEDNVRKILKVPENYLVESIIGFGYPKYKPKSIPLEDLSFDKVRKEKF